MHLGGEVGHAALVHGEHAVLVGQVHLHRAQLVLKGFQELRREGEREGGKEGGREGGRGEERGGGSEGEGEGEGEGGREGGREGEGNYMREKQTELYS